MFEVYKYEYGIVYIKENELHRFGMTIEQAKDFIDPNNWNNIDPTKIFKIVQRPVGKWEDYKNEKELPF